MASSSSLGRYSRAFQLLEERFKLATEPESRRQELVTLRSFARLYRQVGDCPKARSFYRQAVREAGAVEDGIRIEKPAFFKKAGF
nr:tetratricopeptide repeat protein [Oscillatoria sp. PCC 10802]